MSRGEAATVLCFGDSNTHGTCPMAQLGDIRRYPAALRWTGALRAAPPEGAALIEEGHPGRTTLHDDPIEGAHKNGLALLPAILETHRPVDLVILMLGTNDLKARFAVTPADIARSVDRLCEVILSPGAGPGLAAPRLLVIAPPPIEETGCLAGMFEGGAVKSRALAPLIGSVARGRGAAFLDAGAHMAVSPVDGVHFEPEGHAALGAAVVEAVGPLLN